MLFFLFSFVPNLTNYEKSINSTTYFRHVLFSCDKDEVYVDETANDSKKVASKNSGHEVYRITN